MVDVAELVSLQAVDLRLDEYKKELKSLQIQLNEPSWRKSLISELDCQRDLLVELTQARKTSEDATHAIREKVKAEETKLYGGTITDARELQALQEEIFALRRQLKSQEELLLDAMTVEERSQAALVHLEKVRDGSEASWETYRSEVQVRYDAVKAEAAVVEEEVDEQRKLIDARDLSVYDEHRSRWPIAVAQSVSGVCGSCRLALPTTVLIRARRGTEVIYCPACACIVYLR